MQTEEATEGRMSGTYVRAPCQEQGQTKMQRSKSQIERTAKVIQEALMEAAASVRDRRRRGPVTRGRQDDRRPAEPSSTTGSSTSPRKTAA